MLRKYVLRKKIAVALLSVSALLPLGITSIANATSISDSKGQVVLVYDDHVETDDISNATMLGDWLQSKHLYAHQVRTADAKPLNPNETITAGSRKVLFVTKKQVSIKDVSIPYPTITKKSDDLYVGESKVETQGVDGSGIITTITLTDPSANDNTNKTENTLDKSLRTEEKLTVTKSPVAKVVLEGTKVRLGGNNSNTNYKVNTNPPPPNVDMSNTAVKLAWSKLGHPYIFGTQGPNTFDCSGLIYWIYHTNLGLNIPRTAYAQGLSGVQIPWEQIQPGDVVYSPEHIMLYIGDGRVIHASRPGVGVILSNISWAKASGYRVARLK